MCLGVPMQVIESRGLSALCRGRVGERTIDLALVGEQPPGTWILTFLGTARERVDADYADRVDAALDALEAAMRGETDLDHHFADLLGRTPELPPHLRGSA